MCVLAVFVYGIGAFFHWKVIKVSNRDKQMTWKTDVFNSVMLISHYAHVILMHGVTLLVKDLYIYTGSWFCYASKALVVYGNAHVTGHSFIIAIMKYVAIVQHEKVRNIGEEKAKNILFWINIIYPAYVVGMFNVVRPDFFFAYDGISQANRCLGKSDMISSQDNNKTATKLHNLCEISPPLNQTSLVYGIYIVRKATCWLHVSILYFNLWNVLEFFLYCIIFDFMRR
jgi:hypothetical protein